jgi:hypothetical protein
MFNQPVYPKEDSEHKKRVRDRFLKLVKNTNWGDNEPSIPLSKRGRKPKVTERIKAVPRTPSEVEASKQKYNWFKKFEKK